MEFLKRELIEAMSQNDEHLTTESENIWNENCQKVWKLFLKSKKELPKNLVKILEDGFFHDAIIERIELHEERKKNRVQFDLIITILFRGIQGFLIHKDVTDYNTALKNLSNFYGCGGDYLYGELFKDSDGLWVHNFLCFEYDEINIRCKKIDWKIIN